MKRLAATLVLAAATAGGCEVLDVLGPVPPGPRGEQGAISGSGAVLTAWPMDCSICAQTIATRAMRIEGVATAVVDMERGAVVVTFQPGASVSRDLLVRAVEDAGFHLRDIRPVF
jgi:copper chaperone CopZ